MHFPLNAYLSRAVIALVVSAVLQACSQQGSDGAGTDVKSETTASVTETAAVETADEAISFWDNISRILFMALPMLVSISLVVGGIVIMNIMLVSVMERTREIGVRKALGARRRDILTQVLIESATLSTVGAAFGVAVGLGIAKTIEAVSVIPAAVAPRWIVLGVALGLSVGVIAGVYPASQASKLDPVDALRYE